MFKLLPIILALAIFATHSADAKVASCLTCPTDCDKADAAITTAACAVDGDDEMCVITPKFEFRCGKKVDDVAITVECPQDGLAAATAEGCQCKTVDCNKKAAATGAPVTTPKDVGGNNGGVTTPKSTEPEATKGPDTPGEPDGSTSNVASGILILLSALFAGWTQFSEIKL